MDGTCGVNGSRERHFTNDEETALRKDESTSAIANAARRANGGKEGDVTVRGDDKTLDQVMHDQKGFDRINKVEAAAAAVHGADVFANVLGAHASTAAGATALAIGEIGLAAGGAVLGVAAAHANMIHMEHVKTERKEGASRDQLHGAIAWTLDIPDGFKNEEAKRLGITLAAHGPAVKIGQQFTKAQDATLQMHCDKGMHGAQEMMASGQSKEAFLASHPAIKERYDADAAYRCGFDSLVWSKSQSDGDATYKEQVDKLQARDGWYAESCISVRS